MGSCIWKMGFFEDRFLRVYRKEWKRTGRSMGLIADGKFARDLYSNIVGIGYITSHFAVTSLADLKSPLSE